MIIDPAQVQAISRPSKRYLKRLQDQGIKLIAPDYSALAAAISKWSEHFGLTELQEFCRWIGHGVWESGYFYLFSEPKSKSWLKRRYWDNEGIRKDLGNRHIWHSWAYKGGGLYHLTGRQNVLEFWYWLLKNQLPMFDMDNPGEIATDMDLCVLAGIFFWLDYELGAYTDFTALTVKIQGSESYVEQRQALCNRAVYVLNR